MEVVALKQAGFTNGEIKVYMALLELGETSTGAIIKKSKITGSKVYEILEKLIEKGLASYVIKDRTKYFQGAPPKRILDYLKREEEKFNENKSEIEKLIPSLQAKQKDIELSQSAQVFEGWEGMRTVFNIILEETGKNKTYYAITLGHELADDKVITFLKNHHARRVQKQVKVKLLVNPTDKKYLKNWSKLNGLDIKHYKYSLPVGIYIFENYVLNITFTHKTAFLIKSPYISDSYKKFFEDIWKKAKK